MKSALMPALVLSCTLAACSASSVSGVHITRARATTLTCDQGADNLYKPSGLLDLAGQSFAVAAATTPAYLLFLSWESTIQPQTSTVGGQTLNDATQYTFYASQVELKYASADPSIKVANATEQISATLPPGSGPSQNAIAFDLFPPPVPTRLASLIPPGTVATGPVINVSARIHGKIGGEATATDWFTFPVQVVNSGVTAGSCTGTATVHPGACGYGYDTVNACR